MAESGRSLLGFLNHRGIVFATYSGPCAHFISFKSKSNTVLLMKGDKCYKNIFSLD